MIAHDMPGLQPDREQMMRHLQHLFADQMEGKIELAWTPPDGREIDQAHQFELTEFEELIEYAHEINSKPGQNVYIGAALRKSGTQVAKRANDGDYLSTVAAYVDLDDPGSAETAKALYAECRPTLAVVTGRVPHTRAQLWWKFDIAMRDGIRHRALMEAICAKLGGDSTVVNSSRVMRLGGSIAWPKKDGRQAEMTAAIGFDDARPLCVSPEKLERVFPPSQVLEFPTGTPVGDGRSPITGKLSPEYLIHEIQAGRQWHNNMVKLVAHMIAKGWPDSQILVFAHALTLPGWTADQTAKEMGQAIEGARRKGWTPPPPETNFDPETGEILDAPKLATAEAEDEPFPASSLVGQPPARRWIVPDWLPCGYVTSLYGTGGTGKSLLAMQLGNCVASGMPWLGLETAQGRVLAVFAEDDRDEIWRRQRDIERAQGGIGAGSSDLYLWPRVGFDNLLQLFEAKKMINMLTPFYEKLKRRIADIRPLLVIIDTAADFYGGDEMVRNQVNHFIKATLGSFCTQYNCTVLMLAHPSKSGMGSGEGDGGSTAWNNSVRSRWYLTKPEAALDPDSRILTRQKANYSTAGKNQKIEIIWQAGAFCLAETPGDRLAPDMLKSLLTQVQEAFDSGNPFGASAQSERPLLTWMTSLFEIEKEQAKRWQSAWIANGVLVSERVSRAGSRKGLKVVKWPS